MTCLHNIRYKKLYDNKVFPLGSTEKLLSSTQNDTFSNPRRYAFLLKDARNYWKMFESEGDKKKKVYPACPMYGARRIHHFILWVRIILIDTSRKKITLDAIWIADTNLNMILFSESCIRI